MGRRRSVEKIIGVILVVIGVAVLVYGQSSVNAPLVSDKEVAVRDSTIRVVDKDEIQRIVQKMAENQKRLENRIVLLEAKVNNLESQIKGGE